MTAPDDVEALRRRIARLEDENARLRAGMFEPSRAEVVRVPPGLEAVFARATTIVRDFFRDVEVDPARALISIGGERYVLVRAGALSVDFLDTLVQLYADRGEEEAHAIGRSFLFDIAHTVGLHDARSFHERQGVIDPHERLSMGTVNFAFTGWGMVDIDPRSRPIPDDDFCLVYDHTYSFEAASTIRAGRTSKRPVCILGAGYSSGWTKASFGLELTAVEIACRAAGDATCRFVMAPPHRVADQIRAHFPESHAAVDGGGRNDIPTYFERKRVEEDLRRSLERLGKAQEELVRKERLATVGLLVSSVAHEVNTPLGVAITASSIVGDELRGLRETVERGQLTKAQLRAFMERVGQADAMTRNNLERAATLVTNFKRVAVDTATSERRRIALVPYLEQTVESLRPLTRRRAVEVVVRGESFERTTFPGALAQIVTNFVSNTVEHGARDDGRPTHATLDVTRHEDGGVRITYADDGRGMQEEVQRQAFVPFFSTRRSEGGTGLGLHIVQTLVVDVLHGTLALESTGGDGVRFAIELPAEEPDTAAPSRA